MHAEITRYLDELAVQRRASPHTLTAYRRDLDQLDLLARQHAAGDVLALTPSQLRRALMDLHARDLAPRSIARTLSGWRSFYTWLARHKRITTNPADNLRAPKRARTLPKALGVDQAAQLLDHAPEGPLEQRDAAMFELFYSSGLRLAELVGLDWPGGIDLDAGEVTVTGKRNKTRVVPLGAKAHKALQEWLHVRSAMAGFDSASTPRDSQASDARANLATGEPALFLSRRGTRLTSRQVANRLGQWAQRSGLGQHVHPHMLRHSFASHLLQSSGDLRAVQEMLGHASIAATQIYTHLDFQHLAKVYDQAHPRARSPKQK